MKLESIVVLGGGINPDGSLPEEPKRRVQKAIEFSEDTQYFIFSTKYSFLLETIPADTEANAMKKYAIDSGIEEKKIITEAISKDTLGNAYFTKIILKEMGHRNIGVITSDFHMNRAKFLFDLVLGEDYRIDWIQISNAFQQKETRLRNFVEKLSLLYLKKIGLKGIRKGDDKAVADYLFTKHPAYSNRRSIIDDLYLKIVHNINMPGYYK